MRMLCAVLESTSGEVLLDGKEVTSMGADYRNVLGYLPQDFGYYPDLTVYDYMMYISSIKRVKKCRLPEKKSEAIIKIK